MPPSFLRSLNQVKRPIQVYSKAASREYHCSKNQYNLICPLCDQRYDRSQIKWYPECGRNCGVCPECNKLVTFSLFNKPGRKPGYSPVREETKQMALDLISEAKKPIVPSKQQPEPEQSSNRDQKLLKETNLDDIDCPMSYLTAEEISKLLGMPLDIVVYVRKILNYKWKQGRPSFEFLHNRERVLKAVKLGVVLNDASIFEKYNV